MLILIKNANIIAPQSKYHNSKKDILIEDGIIKKIASKISSPKAKSINSKNLHVSIGWLDIGAVSGEPGYEHRETLESLSSTAAAGGYTGLAIFPNTDPIIDNKSSIRFVLNETEDHLVDYYPIASISKDCAGKELTEMMDLKKHGAIAYSDGTANITSNGLLLRALQYAKGDESVIMHNPNDPSTSNGNNIHEGIISTQLGLKGSPSLSEVLTLERDILLSKYAQSKLLVHNISAKESVEKIASQIDKNITASVSYLNLCLTDDALQSFDSNYKVSPPLRSEDDRQALTKGVNNGKVQIITSNHIPLEEEAKKKEIVYAEPGTIGLQTSFAGLITHNNKISLNRMVNCMAINPRKLLSLDIPQIAEGEKAELTIFDPQASWTFNEDTNQSKSRNSPFWNKTLSGKVIGVVNGDNHYFNTY